MLLGRKVMTNLDGVLKSRDITLPTKVHLVKAVVYPVVMHGCESWTRKKVWTAKPGMLQTMGSQSVGHDWVYWTDFTGDKIKKRKEKKKSWALKNWCFWTVVLEKPLQSLLDCKEIQSVHPKRNQSWIFIERTDAEELTLAIWCEELTHWKISCCWERLKVGGEGDDRGETVGWHHRHNGHEFEQALGVGDGQGSPVCCILWHCRVGHDWATELNWTEYSIVYVYHNFFIHSSVDGHLGFFHVLAIVNCAAVNNGIHVSFSILVSSGYMPRSGIAGSYGGFIPSF